jgi:hypothetical protein
MPASRTATKWGFLATAVESDAYKRWLLGLAETVAVAGKEDQGFLGMGGVLVNDAERAALRELAGVLGIDDASAST